LYTRPLLLSSLQETDIVYPPNTVNVADVKAAFIFSAKEAFESWRAG
jgi:hypothetical protein